MSSCWIVTLANEKTWVVGSRTVPVGGSSLNTDAQVIIPVEQLDDMSDAEIGKAVRKLVRPARLCYATELAGDVMELLAPDQFRLNSHSGIPDRWHDDKHTLSEFADESEEVREALGLLNAKWLEVARRLAERSTRALDKKLGASYSNLFDRVAQRDGSKCITCDREDDLRLMLRESRPQAEARNPDNLQLQCCLCIVGQDEQDDE